MKFRGRMTQLLAIRKFYEIIVTLSKHGKNCLFRLTQDKLYFIISDVNVFSGGPCVWCELNQISFFTEYNMQGVSDEQPEIFFEYNPVNLAKMLIIIKSAIPKSLKMKLSKKNNVSLLCFEIELLSESSRLCTHEIPVGLIPRRLWKDFRQPALDAFSVSICLPDLNDLRHISERYRGIGLYMTLKANQYGMLTCLLESNLVSLGTHFKNLEYIVNDGNTKLYEKEVFASVRIDLRRFSAILSSEQISSRKVVANFIDEKMIHLDIIHNDVRFQFYIPAINA